VYGLSGGGVRGVEALVRWQHPLRGLLTADHFVPIAERSRLILDLGRWVLDEACRQTAELKGQGYLHPDAFVAVNVSGRHVHDTSLVGDVERALDRSGLDPRNLVLEMTESVLIEHSEETLETLAALKRLGTRLAIDDFGTGYSSLSYVHRLPIDVLKIDQSFLEQVGDDGRTGLAEWIVRIGHALGLETVAEGIERPGQLDALRATHCDLGQGFLLCRPLPIDALRHHLGASVVPEGVLGA
jgi:EAL domain-containing protein (putative c-di-GMP-specific phosphodiesterase class I)